MIVAAFKVVDKLNCLWLFQKTFLLNNIRIEVILSMPFLILSNADVKFAKKKLTWKTYTIKKAVSSIC